MKNSYALNGSTLKVWLKRPSVGLRRSLFNTQGSDGRQVTRFSLFALVGFTPASSDVTQHLHVPWNTLVSLTFSVNCPPNHKIWVRSSYGIYLLRKLTRLLPQYTVPGSSQVKLLQFITINCFILEQTILMRKSGFKLIQKRRNWKVSSLFVLFLLTRFYDMTRLQIALFMINWQLCKLYMLKAICCTSCSGEKS